MPFSAGGSKFLPDQVKKVIIARRRSDIMMGAGLPIDIGHYQHDVSWQENTYKLKSPVVSYVKQRFRCRLRENSFGVLIKECWRS